MKIKKLLFLFLISLLSFTVNAQNGEKRVVNTPFKIYTDKEYIKLLKNDTITVLNGTSNGFFVNIHFKGKTYSTNVETVWGLTSKCELSKKKVIISNNVLDTNDSRYNKSLDILYKKRNTSIKTAWALYGVGTLFMIAAPIVNDKSSYNSDVHKVLYSIGGVCYGGAITSSILAFSYGQKWRKEVNFNINSINLKF